MQGNGKYILVVVGIVCIDEDSATHIYFLHIDVWKTQKHV